MFYLNEVKATQKCYKCGMCMFQCPIYSVHRNEVYSPKGKINAIDSIINTKKNCLNDLSEIFRECNLCHHCTQICPAEIDKPELVIEYRSRLNKIKPVEDYEVILNNIRKNGNPYSMNSGFHKNVIKEQETPKEKNKTLLFLGCTIRYKLPEIVDSVMNFLDKSGIDFTILEDEPCCGNILKNLGFVEDARIMAKRNSSILNKFEKIITLCPGCYSMLKRQNELSGSKFEVYHILEIIHKARNHIKSNTEEPVFFQVPCHIYNNDKKFEEIIPEITPIFRQISTSLDVTNAPKCCGAGGGMLLYDKEYVMKRMDILMENESAQNVITACPFCYLNFKKHTSRNVSYITENLEVVGELKIELKSDYKKSLTSKKEEKVNIPMILLKYKISSRLKKILGSD